MWAFRRTKLLLTAALLLRQTAAESASCSSTISASYPEPSVTDGYVARLIANNLTNARGIKFDSKGALLVVESGVGVSALSLVDGGDGCLSVGNRKLVIDEPALNHGIELSPDGGILYASSEDTVWSWQYDAEMQVNTSEPMALVTGMAGDVQITRTLLLSKMAPGLMIINRGSDANVDPVAADISTGRGQIKAFNVTNTTMAYEFNDSGLLLGWGLRNNVGLSEHPTTGGIYSAENSADKLNRSMIDIHENNPADKLNFLGYLNGTYSPNQGRNFGYPECYAAWEPEQLPDFTGTVGEQFSVAGASEDSMCSASERQEPRLALPAHAAPIDIKFNDAGTTAWLSNHGSKNREGPIGYNLVTIEFANGEPVAESTSKDAEVEIMANQDLSKCPDACFRPTGLTWDTAGRLFMSSNSTGEIYVILRADGSPTNSLSPNGTSTGSAPAATTSGSASFWGASGLAVSFAVLAFLL